MGKVDEEAYYVEHPAKVRDSMLMGAMSSRCKVDGF